MRLLPIAWQGGREDLLCAVDPLTRSMQLLPGANQPPTNAAAVQFPAGELKKAVAYLERPG